MSKPAESDFSLKNPFISDQTIDQLLENGYIGVDLALSDDSAFAGAAHKFKEQVKWTKSQVDEEGDVALMTSNLSEFDQLLNFMLAQFGWCPQVYSNQEIPDVFIFSPQSELQEGAIFLATDGEKGWQGSLYSLDYVDSIENANILGFIFATKPKDDSQQEWLLVEVNRQKNTRGWSVHSGTLEQVYYIWAERVEISEPNFKPTTDEVLDALSFENTQPESLSNQEEEEEEEIDFSIPEDMKSEYTSRRDFVNFANAFNHLHYTKKDLAEYIANNGMDDAESIMGEVIFNCDNEECDSYGVPESLDRAISDFGSLVIENNEEVTGDYGLSSFFLEYLGSNHYLLTDECEGWIESFEGDSDLFLSDNGWGDKTKFLEDYTYMALRSFLSSYPTLINMDEDEDELVNEIDVWYEESALPKLIPIFKAIKEQFEHIRN
jgi:serine/threonine-protein kinase